MQEERLIKPFLVKEHKAGQITYSTWNDLGLRLELQLGLRNWGFEFPTQSQCQVIPKIASPDKIDLLCQARSGIGKTWMFLIGLLETMVRQSGGQFKYHQCIILVNTRELAHQINYQFNFFSSYMKPFLRSTAIIGGTDFMASSQSLDKKEQAPHILVCTLGRLLHQIQCNRIMCENVRCVVIDECDKMLGDQVVRKQVQYVLQKLPKKRQLLMFTATLSQEMRDVCVSLMRQNSLVLQLQNKSQWKEQIQHYYCRVQPSAKLLKLIALLDNLPFNQAIIFANTVDKVIRLTQDVTSHLFNPICIHSQMPQSERLQRYDQFRSNGSCLMIATDVLGRGIDIKHVNLVINYDIPRAKEDYWHRVHRAGRFITQGKVINLLEEGGKENDFGLLDVFSKHYGFEILQLPKEVRSIQQ